MIRKLLQDQTLRSFDYQWRHLHEGWMMFSDEWFADNVCRIITDELLCISPEWFNNKCVLDAGCGIGRWALGFLRLGCRVTGVDYSHHALDRMQDYVSRFFPTGLGDRLQTLQVNLLEPPTELLAQSFDVVFSFGVLHHTGNTRQALANVSSMVKDDGVLFLYLYGKKSIRTMKHCIILGLRRLILSPLPFDFKRRLIARLHPNDDLQQLFDLLSPTINTRHTFGEIERWLRDFGFTEVTRTVQNTELFVRAAKPECSARPFYLPRPKPPYWYETR